MKISDIDFRKMLHFSPETGRLLLGKDRMLLFRQEAFATLRRLMIEQLGEELARGLLSQFGYRSAVGDHKALMTAYRWDSEQDEMGAGPAMHAWEGLVYVEPGKLEYDRKAGTFYMSGRWLNSYEAEIHLAEYGRSERPVCHTITGYASGWCSSFLGAPVVATETMCKGKGDPDCWYELKHGSGWGPEADPWKKVLKVPDTSLSRELERKLDEVERYRATVATIGTPIIQVWQDVVVLPVIGAVDERRAEEMMDTLVRRVGQDAVRCVLLDLTGVDTIDTRTADQLVRMARAVSLLGARCLITGIRADVARTLTHMGGELGGIQTMRDLKQALQESLRFLGYSVQKLAQTSD